MGISHHGEAWHSHKDKIIPLSPCEPQSNKALNHLALSQMLVQETKEAQVIKNGSSRAIRIQDEKK